MPTVSISTKKHDVIVIGAGAAGLMAAYSAAHSGADVLVLEKNEKAGKKIYITGKGRCNVTNDCDEDGFIKACTRNGRFLYSAYRQFTSQDMMRFLEDHHCPVKVERGKRVFPVSDKASDITKALLRSLEENHVTLFYDTTVAGVCKDGDTFLVSTKTGSTLRSGSVVIATGGLCYPQTGSTGDGYGFARVFGHSVQECLPCLTGFDTADSWPKELQGLSLRNVRLTAREGKTILFDDTGEMLFTHFGVSGPLFLDLSSRICGKDISKVYVSLDLKPGMTAEQLDARLIRLFRDNGRKAFSTVMHELMPSGMIRTFCTLCEIAPDADVPHLKTDTRSRLTALLKEIPLRLADIRPFTEAIITRGGVSIKEINPSTMESKIVPGLYFAGEVIDTDAVTGGFNLQTAFCTGYLAGRKAAEKNNERKTET